MDISHRPCNKITITTVLLLYVYTVYREPVEAQRDLEINLLKDHSPRIYSECKQKQLLNIYCVI